MSERVSNRVAAIQMVSGHDIEANLAEAKRLMTEAAAQGASVAVLPENFAVLSTRQMVDCGRQEAGPEPVIRSFLSEQAKAGNLDCGWLNACGQATGWFRYRRSGPGDLPGV